MFLQLNNFLTKLMSLVQERVSLSDNQVKKLVNAANSEKIVSFRLSANQVKEGKYPVFLDAEQSNKVAQARLKNKGVVIRFGQNMHVANRQDGGILPAILALAQRQEGGILPALIPILVALGTAAATAGVSFGVEKGLEKLFPDKKGKGLFPHAVSPTTSARGITPFGTGLGHTCSKCGHHDE
jgi:hypothetical protein